MNILHLTFEAPSAFSGGGLAVKQSAYSLQRIGDVTYCGPNIPENCKKIRDGYSDLINLYSIQLFAVFQEITICHGFAIGEKLILANLISFFLNLADMGLSQNGSREGILLVLSDFIILNMIII